MKERTYICCDLKSFYASVECVERGLDPMTTNLVVADQRRTEKTICLAVSPSLKAYGIAAVYPADGREEQVKTSLSAFIDQQRQNFQQYLVDQYEIAQDARLETLSDGTILMVMCEDQDGVFDSIRASIEEQK